MKYDKTTIANRYNSAREIPKQTMQLWLDSLALRIPYKQISTVLDIGCGTGRFSEALADLFKASVVGVDPSEKMLRQASKNIQHKNVSFQKGNVESIPVDDSSICIIFMSMVYHHIEKPEIAAREFFRVLRPSGFLCIRNSTKDLLHYVPYLKYFPKAMAINKKRIPSKWSVIDTMRSANLTLKSHDIINQEFSKTLDQYCKKIEQRGLSDLVMISDSDFNDGINAMKQDVLKNPNSGPITEKIDLFVFKKEAEPDS